MTSREDEGPHATDAVAPSSPDAYARALDRLLDGLEGDDGEAGGADAARAAADVELISRGLRLIAAELAAGPTAAAAGKAPVADGSGAAATAPIVLGQPQGGDAPVVPIRRPSGAQPRPVAVPPPGEAASPDAPWWRRPAPAVLAAAASLALVIGLAVPALDGMGGGESDTAQQAPAAAADAGAAAPAGDRDAASDPASEPAREAPAATSGLDGAAADTGAAAPAADAGAAADSAASAGAGASAATSGAAPKTATAAKAAAGESAGAGGQNDSRLAGRSTFNRLVACARAIVVGEVVRVEQLPASDRASLTLRVTEYVVGSGAAERTFVVGSAAARFADGTAPLAAGQRGLFLIPGNRDVEVRGWLGDAVPTGRKEVRAAQAQRDSC